MQKKKFSLDLQQIQKKNYERKDRESEDRG